MTKRSHVHFQHRVGKKCVVDIDVALDRILPKKKDSCTSALAWQYAGMILEERGSTWLSVGVRESDFDMATMISI